MFVACPETVATAGDFVIVACANADVLFINAITGLPVVLPEDRVIFPLLALIDPVITVEASVVDPCLNVIVDVLLEFGV
jgi:hypothetical protein